MNEKQVDEAFDKSFLDINKKLNEFNGLWPHKSVSDKAFRRVFVFTILIIVTLPQFLGLNVHCGKNFAICAENIAGLAYLIGVFAKYTVPVISKEKFVIVYKKIAENWLLITDPKEKSLVEKYAKSGRFKTLGYVGYCFFSGIAFSQMILVSVILDYIIPLNETRKKILTTKAEYPFDPYEYYYELYVVYTLATIVSVSVLISTDTTYTAIIHQSLGIFAIVKHRLRIATEEKDPNASYDVIVSAIDMHKKALEFVELIESTYQLAFLSFIAVTVVFLSFGSIILVEHSDDIIDLIRLSLFEVGAMIHIFFISWPGQLVIDHTEDLFRATYTNEWYYLSRKAKVLLKILMLRCVKPCFLTAGGFYIMNFQNYGSIVKTTLSYVTVALSFK